MTYGRQQAPFASERPHPQDAPTQKNALARANKQEIVSSLVTTRLALLFLVFSFYQL